MRHVFCVVTIFFTVLCFTEFTHAEDIQTVTNINNLSEIVNTTWISNNVNKIMPPGDSKYKNSFGAVAFTANFDTNFIASLIAITNYNDTNSFLIYPVEVIETTNGADRIRNYYSAISTNPTVLYSSEVSIVDYPISWIEDVFGEAPQWLSGSDLQKWYDDRDPWRQHVFVDLIATSSVPDYMAMLTNTLYTYSGTNTNSTLSIYSNNIVFFETEANSGEANLYLHAPTNVPSLDIFAITDLLDISADGSGWNLTATMEHNLDPLLFVAGITDPLKFWCAGNATIDSDNDGLSDIREIHLFGTDRYLRDSDGDGITDGDEILNYDLNALSVDTDNDGITDDVEIASGTSPYSADSDGDGLTDYDEIYTYFRYVDPLDADTDDDGLSDMVEIVTHNTYAAPDTALARDTDDDGFAMEGNGKVTLWPAPLEGYTISYYPKEYHKEGTALMLFDTIMAQKASPLEKLRGDADMTYSIPSWITFGGENCGIRWPYTKDTSTSIKTKMRARADRCYTPWTGAENTSKELAADGESCGMNLDWEF